MEGPEEQQQHESGAYFTFLKAVYDGCAAEIASKADCVKASSPQVSSKEARMALIDNYIADYAMKAGAVGAVTGIGGPLTALVAVIPEIFATLRFQLLLVMHIAVIQGYPLNEATFLLAYSVAIEMDSQDRGAFMAVANVGGQVMLHKMFKPGTRAVLGQTNKVLGYKVSSRISSRASVATAGSLAAWVPLIGSAISAGLNMHQIRGFGRYAIRFFPYYDIFISHSWGRDNLEHQLVMSKLVPALEARGWKVLVDEQNRSRNPDPAVKAMIADCKVFVPCFSREYFEKVQNRGSSNSCCLEFDYCLAVGVTMAPVRIVGDVDRMSITNLPTSAKTILSDKATIYDLVGISPEPFRLDEDALERFMYDLRKLIALPSRSPI